jgi:hypothetical protein
MRDQATLFLEIFLAKSRVCDSYCVIKLHQIFLVQDMRLEQFLELPEGILSPDTFRRVFERIKPKEFASCSQYMLCNFNCRWRSFGIS